MSETPTVLGRPDISISSDTVRLGDQSFHLSGISKVKGSFRYKFFNHHGCLLAATYLSFFIFSIMICCGPIRLHPDAPHDLVAQLTGVLWSSLGFVAVVVLYRVMKQRPHHMIVVDSSGTEHHYIVPKFEHIDALRKARREAKKEEKEK